ncbi:hypothetical protein D3C78_1169930 [compost metagenome]
MRIDIAVQVQALHRQLVLLVGQHLLGRNDAGLDDALLVIQVGEEHVQRLDPLDAPALDDPPFTGGDTAGDGVERNQALCALLVPIEREGNPGAMKQQIGLASPLCQKLVRRLGQPTGKLPIMRADLAAGIVHLIKIGADHAVLLVTRTSRPSQGPCQRHKRFDINQLDNQRASTAPFLCGKCSNLIAPASLQGVVIAYHQHSQS